MNGNIYAFISGQCHLQRLYIKYKDMFLPLLSVEGKYFVRLGKKKLRWKIFFQGGKLGSLISRKFSRRIHYSSLSIRKDMYVYSSDIDYIHDIGMP